MVNVVYWTYILKIIDLVETVVFVLRKKHNQVSLLHVYHHISTVLVIYVCLKYFAGGMLSMQVVINSSVHVMMYTYYLLASLGPSWQSFLSSVKPYITQVQIVSRSTYLYRFPIIFFYSYVEKLSAITVVNEIF